LEVRVFVGGHKFTNELSVKTKKAFSKEVDWVFEELQQAKINLLSSFEIARSFELAGFL
jgi:hypothetical protein